MYPLAAWRSGLLRSIFFKRVARVYKKKISKGNDETNIFPPFDDTTRPRIETGGWLYRRNNQENEK